MLPQLVLLLLASTPAAPVQEVATPAPLETEVAAFGWRAREADSVCGVQLPDRVSNPAKVDFRRLSDATEEMRKLKREGINPNSAEGQALIRAAKRRIREAAEGVRQERGHCSVWKSISHTDGREVPDLTAEVLRRL